MAKDSTVKVCFFFFEKYCIFGCHQIRLFDGHLHLFWKWLIFPVQTRATFYIMVVILRAAVCMLYSVIFLSEPRKNNPDLCSSSYRSCSIYLRIFLSVAYFLVLSCSFWVEGDPTCMMGTHHGLLHQRCFLLCYSLVEEMNVLRVG